MRVPPAQACTRSVQNSFDRSQTERPRVNARRTLTRHRAGGDRGTGRTDRGQIAVILVLAELLVAVFVRIVLDVLAVATAVRPTTGRRNAMVRVIEGAWVVVAAVAPYISAAEVMVLAVDFRFLEGAHAVVVVIAKALVFERLPRHVDFVIVVLCVVLEGGTWKEVRGSRMTWARGKVPRRRLERGGERGARGWLELN